jgi:hypothetical protein
MKDIQLEFGGFSLVCLSCQIGKGLWSFHLFPQKLPGYNRFIGGEEIIDEYVWGHKIEDCFFVEFWGLGPLFLASRC